MKTATDMRNPTLTGSSRWKADSTPQEQAELKAYLQHVFSSPVMQGVASRTISLLEPGPGQSILEVGCGTGVFLPLLAREVGPSGRVNGVDYSAGMVTDAGNKMAAAGLSQVVTVQEGDACHLPFPDDSFDAAHCERVLMHLEDPNVALREMVRVVRPGGRVVVGEPDWAGFRIDHPDREEFDALFRRSLACRHCDMGLTLVRRMSEAGLTELRMEPMLGVFTDVGIFRSFGLDLSRGADLLVEEGAISRPRADALMAKLDELSFLGRYYATAAFHLVAGRVSENS